MGHLLGEKGGMREFGNICQIQYCTWARQMGEKVKRHGMIHGQASFMIRPTPRPQDIIFVLQRGIAREYISLGDNSRSFLIVTSAEMRACTTFWAWSSAYTFTRTIHPAVPGSSGTSRMEVYFFRDLL